MGALDSPSGKGSPPTPPTSTSSARAMSGASPAIRPLFIWSRWPRRRRCPSWLARSTLADCDLELMRIKEHDAVVAMGERDAAVRLNEERSRAHEEQLRAFERERAEHVRTLRETNAQAQEELGQRDQDIVRGQEDIVGLRGEIASREAEIALREDKIASVEAELAAARQLNRRTEESVTWQAFQRARGRLYGCARRGVSPRPHAAPFAQTRRQSADQAAEAGVASA